MDTFFIVRTQKSTFTHINELFVNEEKEYKKWLMSNK